MDQEALGNSFENFRRFICDNDIYLVEKSPASRFAMLYYSALREQAEATELKAARKLLPNVSDDDFVEEQEQPDWLSTMPRLFDLLGEEKFKRVYQ